MPAPVLRAKFRVHEVLRSIHADGHVETEKVKLHAVYGNNGENKEWCRWTPSGTFEITVSNPDAFGKLTNGHEFFIDFTPANAQDPPSAPEG